MTLQELKDELESIRQDAHNGKDVYSKVVQLQESVNEEGIDKKYNAAHSVFVTDVLDGVKPEDAYQHLQESIA